MCGIYGIASKKKQVLVAQLDRAIHALKHRGPDHKARWLSQDEQVGLVQTRLSINDLSEIELPLYGPQKRVHAVVNGEFYDFKRIRQKLRERGHHFRTGSDAEILIHLYLEEGIHCLHHLRGEFAFILHDQRTQTLYAARDRFGAKPLYYANDHGQLHVSSEIPALFAAGAIEPCWNTHALYDFTLQNSHPTETLYEGVSQLAPGKYLCFNRQGLSLHTYWDADYSEVFSDDASEADVIDELSDQLKESIALRLQADVKVACYLSGGLDSSALLGISSELNAQPLDSFTIGFDSDRVDERHVAAKTAEFVGSNLHVLDLNNNDLANNFQEAVINAAHPFANAAGVARYCLSRFVREKGFKVVFSGEGADELFLGYPFMIHEARTDPTNPLGVADIEAEKKRANEVFPIDRTCHERLPKHLCAYDRLLGFTPTWVTTQSYFNASHRCLLKESLLPDLDLYDPYALVLDGIDLKKLQGADQVNKSTYLWLKTMFVNNMLNWIGDRSEMANSVEARLPYLDHHLFESLKRVPTSMKIKGQVEKYLLREVAKPYITGEVYQREKFMFQAPPMKLSDSDPCFKQAKEVILDSLEELPMYDKKALRNYVLKAHQTDQRNWLKTFDVSTTLNTIASIAMLTRHYRVAL